MGTDFGEILFGGVQEVTSFANGVSIELEGQDLPDPSGYYVDYARTPNGNVKPGWRNFATNPLVGANGIQPSDVRQGGVADDKLVTALRAIAGKQPHRIKQAMVDLGDGSFAVKFIAPDGTHRYYRVDADLPVKRDGTPWFAGLGNGGSLWAAMMEKAFTLHRPGLGIGTYHSLRTCTLSEAFGAFGMRQHWVGSYIADIKVALGTGKLVTMQSTTGTIGGGAALTSNTIYIVERVNLETKWEPGYYVEYTYKPAEWHPGKWVDVPVSITLRDPSEREVTVRRDQIGDNFVSEEAWL
jgi:hypothetical protein